MAQCWKINHYFFHILQYFIFIIFDFLIFLIKIYFYLYCCNELEFFILIFNFYLILCFILSLFTNVTLYLFQWTNILFDLITKLFLFLLCCSEPIFYFIWLSFYFIPHYKIIFILFVFILFCFVRSLLTLSSISLKLALKLNRYMKPS